MDLTDRAAAFLEPYLHPDPWSHDALLEALRPRPEDWAVVFDADWAAHAREGFAPLWADPRLPKVNPGQSVVRITAVATGAELQQGGPAVERFPGGYRRVAHALRPEPSWICWSFTAPDETRGMAHNGLVAVGPDRFAWFPKPWRALRPH